MMEFVNGKDDTPYMKWKIHENTGKKISWPARPRLRQSLCHQTTTCAHQHQTWHPTSGRKSSPDFKPSFFFFWNWDIEHQHGSDFFFSDLRNCVGISQVYPMISYDLFAGYSQENPVLFLKPPCFSQIFCDAHPSPTVT